MPHHCLRMFGHWTLSVAGPMAWNALRNDVHDLSRSTWYHLVLCCFTDWLTDWLTDNLCSLLKTFYSRKTECTWHIRSGCNDALYGFMFTLVAFYILESQCGWLSWHHTNLWMKNDPGWPRYIRDITPHVQPNFLSQLAKAGCGWPSCIISFQIWQERRGLVNEPYSGWEWKTWLFR